MADKQPINFMALTRGLLQDLRGAYRERPPHPVSRSEGSGIAQIEQTAARVRADRAAGLAPIEANYRERAEGATALLTRRQQRIEAYAKRERRAVTADPEKFIVAGRVVDAATGVGLPSVKVNVFDAEREHDERLGSTHTDALGYYRLEYTAADLEKLGARPRASVEVLGEDGKAIFTSEKAFAQKLGGTKFVSAAIDGNKVPASRELGARIDLSVADRIEGIKRRIRVSKPKGNLTLQNLRRRPTRGARPERPEGRAQPVRPKAPQQPERPARRDRPSRPKRSGRGGAPAPGGAGRKPVLEDVKGIGDQFAARLKAAGVTQVSNVAAMQPRALAKMLRISGARAEAIVRDARRLTKEP